MALVIPDAPATFAATYRDPSGPTVTVGWGTSTAVDRTPTGADQRSAPVAALSATRFEGVGVNRLKVTLSA